MISLFLAFQLAAVPPRLSPHDSTALVHRARDREEAFIRQWRDEWGLSQLSDPRPFFGARHPLNPPCPRDQCPLWVPQDNAAQYDEALDLDNGLSSASIAIIRLARRALLAFFDSVAAALPGDGWIAGQRIRLRVDQQDLAGAMLDTKQCHAAAWWCLALRGYAAHAGRAIATAAAAFDSSLAVMPDSVRCRWNDLSFFFGAVGWNGMKLETGSAPGDAMPVEAKTVPAFMSESDRFYNGATCAQRDSINTIIWWLARPLYLEPGNERKTEHFARRVLDDLHHGLEADERLDLREHYQGTRLTQAVVQWGWPTVFRFRGSTKPALSTPCDDIGPRINMKDLTKPMMYNPDIDRAHPARAGGPIPPVRLCNYIGNGGLNPIPRPQWVGPRNHTVPGWHAINDPFHSTADDWDLAPPPFDSTHFEDSWWPEEMFFRTTGMLVELAPVQAAFLRRSSTAMLAVAESWDSTTIVHEAPRNPLVGIITSSGPTDSLRIVKHLFAGEPLRGLFVPVASRPLLLGVEMMPGYGTGPAGRSRFGIMPPGPLSALGAGAFALSDPILTRAGLTGEGPATIEAALVSMLGSTVLHAPGTICVFWEAYGLATTDTTEMAIRIVRSGGTGLFARLSTLLRMGASDSVTARWQEARQGEAADFVDGGVTVRPRSKVLDVTRLVAGDYVLEIETTRGGATAVSRRTFTVVR